MERLKELRTRKGYSQQELADIAGVAQHTVSEIELGRRAPHGRTLRKLAAALGVDVLDLTEEPALPKVTAPPSPESSVNDVLGGERRNPNLQAWIRYASQRAKWLERVMRRTTDEEYNNPFLALNTAIQFAIYVGIETAALRNEITSTVLPEADASPEHTEEARTVLTRLGAISEQTDARVKAMMEEAALDEEEKQAHLRVIEGERSA